MTYQDTLTATAARRARQRTLGLVAVLISGVGCLKFVGILVASGPAQAPWGFLLVFVLPFALGRAVLSIFPRVGAGMIGVLAATVVVLAVTAIGSGRLGGYWGDYVLVLLGGPLALAAVVLSLRVLREG